MFSLREVLRTPLRFVYDVQRVAVAVTEMPGLGVAVTGLHTELAGLRSDLHSMPADSRRVADNLDGLRNDLSGLPFVSKTAQPVASRRAA